MRHLSKIVTEIRCLCMFPVVLAGLLASAPAGLAGVEPAPVPFQRIAIDANGPGSAWGKSVGDIDGDGRQDLVVGGLARGLYWYRNPSWQKSTIDPDAQIWTDLEVADVNRDGRNDVVAIKSGKAVWYENGVHGWGNAQTIGMDEIHDIEVADFDGDGDLDAVGRNQGNFGQSGAVLFFYRQDSPTRWTRSTLAIADGEGLIACDVNKDGRSDVAVNFDWYENSGHDWIKHTYTRSWTYASLFLAAGDINGDGRLDFATAPSELAGNTYRISWFEAPADPTQLWTEHVVDEGIETCHHFIAVADFDQDGKADIATAKMQQAKTGPEIRLYLNRDGKGLAWAPQLLARTSSHSMRVVDVEGNGVPSLFGANWNDTPTTEIHLFWNRIPAFRKSRR